MIRKIERKWTIIACFVRLKTIGSTNVFFSGSAGPDRVSKPGIEESDIRCRRREIDSMNVPRISQWSILHTEARIQRKG